ncbi:MAG: phosphoribosylamine--glycine ligase [Nitrospirae bacterium]|nr:phosphoribosylamine--glycine ligase [Nitrospirota bacterium]
MKVLVIGSGGREHALVWKLSQSPRVSKIFCAPGNAGISEIAECIDIKAEDIESLLNFAKYEWIDLTVVGPEAPLTMGIVDAFKKEGRRIFGPETSGAQLEGSKVFAKEFMRKYGIPTAEYKTFTSYLHAEEYIRLKGAPIVIKAEGLAAGKGVFVAETYDEAIDALRKIMKERVFGDAGNKVIVEQCLKGEEASFMVLTDGKTVIPLATSQDHKKGLTKERIDYRGVIYAGLMICNGTPYVLEFNCRFGDPETQPVLMRLNGDFFNAMKAAVDKKLKDIRLSWEDDASVCVVISSRGYPGTYEKDKIIKGLDTLKGKDDLFVFHAGTSINNGEVVTSGGRVLGVTALGNNIKEAKDKVYKAIDKIHFDGIHYRKDIADKAIRKGES